MAIKKRAAIALSGQPTGRRVFRASPGGVGTGRDDCGAAVPLAPARGFMEGDAPPAACRYCSRTSPRKPPVETGGSGSGRARQLSAVADVGRDVCGAAVPLAPARGLHDRALQQETPRASWGIICAAYSVPLTRRDLLSVKSACEFGKTAAVAAVRGVHVVPLRNDSEAIISGNALPHEDLLERPEVAGVDHE